jgi:hypothetical protein
LGVGAVPGGGLIGVLGGEPVQELADAVGVAADPLGDEVLAVADGVGGGSVAGGASASSKYTVAATIAVMAGA